MHKPTRILHYIGSLESGGSQAMLMNIYRNIDRNKIQFDFIVDRKNDNFYENQIKCLGGKIYFFDEYFKGYNYFNYTKQWREFFDNHSEYNLIHCHVRSVASIVLKIAKKKGLKTICHAHGMSNGSGLKSIGKKILQHNIPKYSDFMLACSQDAADWLYGRKESHSKKCIIINNGIDIDKFQFDENERNIIRNTYNISNDDFLIGHIGRFVPIKNHKFIISIADDLIKKNKKIKFMLCGDGPIKSEIMNDVKCLKLENNIFFVEPTDEINKYYNAFDMFILPSYYEGLGIVLIEAQYNGLTCLTSVNIPDEAIISDSFYKKELIYSEWENFILNRIEEDNRNIILNSNAQKYNIINSCTTLLNIYNNCLNNKNF